MGGGCFLVPRLHCLQSLGSPDNMVPEPPAYGDTPAGLPSPLGHLDPLRCGEKPRTLCELVGLGAVLQVAQALLTGALQRGRTPAPPEDPPRLCRYKDYREPPWSEHKYDISKDFWAVLAARLAFVIVFQVRGPARLPEGLWAEAPRMHCCPEKGQEGRNWPGLGVWRLEDSPWSPRGVRCW